MCLYIQLRFGYKLDKSYLNFQKKYQLYYDVFSLRKTIY